MNLIPLKRLIKIAIGRDIYVRRQISCSTLHYGNQEYDWTFCPSGLTEDSIVYSFGIGHDISFDLELIKNFRLTVFAFDPTPRSMEWLKTQKLPENFIYYPWGLSDHDGFLEFFHEGGNRAVSYSEVDVAERKDSVRLDVRKLSTICAALQHTHIDLLKLDIEGSEYRALPDLLKSGIRINQILVEFHHRFKSIQPVMTRDVIQLLSKHDFKIFNVSPGGYEYSFLNCSTQVYA